MTREQTAVVAREPVQIAFDVGDDEVAAEYHGRGRRAIVQFILLPQRRPAATVERPHVTVFVAHIETAGVVTHVGVRGHVARPQHAAAAPRERDHPPLIRDGVHHVVGNNGPGIDIVHALELGTALRRRDRGLPLHAAVAQRHREQLAVGETGVHHTVGDHRRTAAAQGARRHRAVHHPSPRAAVLSQAVQLAVARAHHHHALAHRGRREHLARHLRAPHRRTVLLRERAHLAVARAEQQGLARGGDAAAHVAAQAPLPEEAPLACIVGAQDIVAVHQIQHAVRHHGPKFALRRVLPWTDRPRPCGLHVHLFGDGRQRRLSGDVSGGITAAGETLLFGTRHGEVLALSQKDGAPVWRAQVSSEVLTPPAVSEGVVVVRAGDGKLYGLEQHDGARRWVVDRPVPALTLRGIGAPVIADGVVYAGFANGKLLAVALRDGSVQWEATVATPQGRSELERMVDVDARPIVADDVVYAVAYQGRVVALARSSGRVLWSRDMSSHTDMSYDAGSLYVRDENGVVWAIGRRRGAALWKQDKLHNRASSAPVIFGSDLVVADIEGYLHWLARNDGRLLARHHVGDAGMVGAPVVTDDLLYAIGADGSVFALRAHQR